MEESGIEKIARERREYLLGKNVMTNESVNENPAQEGVQDPNIALREKLLSLNKHNPQRTYEGVVVNP